jgi:hypothetical protein
MAFEDIIRDPNIDPVAALTLNVKCSNQERTDMVVEFIVIFTKNIAM